MIRFKVPKYYKSTKCLVIFLHGFNSSHRKFAMLTLTLSSINRVCYYMARSRESTVDPLDLDYDAVVQVEDDTSIERDREYVPTPV